MNIAVVIGVSEYKLAAQLPACLSDVAQMNHLLLATSKYDDICCITSGTEATPLKEALRKFFGKYHNSDSLMEEALVYFSGHGVYHNDVLLCCSDFDPNRPASTSISNEEIDDTVAGF